MNLNHVAVRSDFSIGESLLQIDKLVDKAKELGYESVTLCDAMSLHAMVDFTNKCKKAGIKPIIGCRIRVYDDPHYRLPSKASGIKPIVNRSYMIKAYVTEESGIKSLLKLLSKGYSAENFYYHSRVGLADVLEMTGVAISTGDLFNVFHHPDHAEIITKLQLRFGDDMVFVELVPINTPLFDTLNSKALDFVVAFGGRTLVTYPTLYLNDGDADSLNVLSAITTNTALSVTYRPTQHVKDFYFKKPEALRRSIIEAHQRVEKWNGVSHGTLWATGLSNIDKLVSLCTYEFKKMEPCLPKMADNEFMMLGRKCIAGWNDRFTKPVLGYIPPPELMPIYKQRLEFELGVLKNMGFSGYFLLVEDLVNWAKNNEIIVGPGRGSVGGSLVAYLLGITDVDPIRFNLLFERFINPERLDLPDADLDFMSSKRHLVVEYLIGKYGADRVAGVSNYSSLASASALRDTGRMFGMNGLELSATKLVPKEHGQSNTLTDAAEAVPELEKFRDTHVEIWGHALKLEGVMRSFGQHAAGIVVAGEPLTERAVVETRGEQPCVNWDKRVVEDWGLIKMDILGLATLDVLEIAKGYIKVRHGVSVNYLRLPLEEPDIMTSFARGDTTGVFQFESPGMKRLLKSLAEGGTLTFEDITAATALYRPGPMDSGLMEDFIQIKQGHREPYYDHPNMEAALKDTYSVIVYQEQVMQLAVDLAGFTRAGADHLRKAMGKKDKEKMAEQRQGWIDGCLAKSGMDAMKAGYLFDKIEAFAGYGFNRSHAVEYTIISIWTMWVRVRYPAEYFAACMSIVKDDKLPGLVLDARGYGIEVLPPDINFSTDKYTIPDDHHILAPFSCVMGCSENTALRIVLLRNNAGGSFADEESFRAAAAGKGSKVNIRVVENLNKVGALVSIQPGAIPARSMDRRRDQIELMPGLIIDAVKSERTTDMTDKFLRAKILHIVNEIQSCKDCSLALTVSPPMRKGGDPVIENAHPSPRMKNNVKFMVIADCPSWQEEKKGKLLEGDGADHVKRAIKAAGLSVGDGYYTTLVKAKKSDKFLTNEQLNGCRKYLERELEIIKPAIIITLGSATTKFFLPGIKGGIAELVGKVIYDPKLDASIVVGINPQQCHFDSTKSEVLDDVFQKVADIIA
jgi:uracil-DNA glycosylase family 4